MSDEIPRMCGWCGERECDRGADSCRRCRSIEAFSSVVPGPEHELTGGRWMRDDLGVQRWIATDVDAARHAEETAAAEIAAAEAENVVCKTCPAKPWEVCTTPSGKPAHGSHLGRIIPRCCPCGSALRSNKASSCKRCATKNARATQERSTARKRDAA